MSSNCSDDVVESWKPQKPQCHRRVTFPELLQLRQTYGLNQQRKLRGYGPFSNLNPHHVASTSYLSYRGAWNPTRMQNAILVVGPGTPASTVRTTRVSGDSGTRNNEADNYSSSSSSSSSDSDENNAEEEVEEEESESSERDHSGDDDRMEEDDDDDDDDSNDTGDSDDDDSGSIASLFEFIQNNGYGDSDEEESSGSEDDPMVRGIGGKNRTYQYRPSMRHGGCINTAAWLTSECGWRLSTVASDDARGVHAVETEEIAHQVVTSGDDRLLKVWDVSEPMGISSPLAGGTATLTPFSSSHNVDKHFYKHKGKWQTHYDSRRKHKELEDGCVEEYRPPGTVRLLTTISTGHRGNVFHVTPLKGRPGVFATCGADGFLRLVDAERSYSGGGAFSSSSSRYTSIDMSTVVIHPMYDNDGDGNGGPRVFDPANPFGYFLRHGTGMCFSHVMLDDVNVGLLCSERGLLRFDLRLPPREQCTRSLLPKLTNSPGMMVRSLRACKACAILPTDSGGEKESDMGQGSTYVFVGGSSPFVALCDLRMTASAQQRSNDSRVLQYYKPMGLFENTNVSVSGIDLSRDRKELLVSYESDQIYTFPIFPNSQSPRRSPTDQLRELLNNDTRLLDENSEEGRHCRWGQGKCVLHDLASYGAHLNRYTFLKNARYAGPRDEYICTGSDSGHAWIYEKATGAVVSFWKADQSTCNGVVPHPTLPIFITYGIDSTAKLWRATTPVDSEVDDSAVGRRKHFRMTQERSYEMTPTVSHWGEVRSILEMMSSEGVEVFPDQIPSIKALRRGRVSHSGLRESSNNSNGRQGIPKIGNNLHNLPDTLKANLYTVLRSRFDDNDAPVESSSRDFDRRISWIRLRHQADKLGLTWNPIIPWSMEGQATVRRTKETLKDSPEDHDVERSELVPEYPSDWIRYDAEMSSYPIDFGDYFCSISHSYADYYRDRYHALDERGVMSILGGKGDGTDDGLDEHKDTTTELQSEKESESVEDTDESFRERDDTDAEVEMGKEENSHLSTEMGFDEQNSDLSIESKEFTRHSSMLLAETVKTLKDCGNAAFNSGKLGLAAYRYDKAIQYGSVAYMDSRKTNLFSFDNLLKNLIMSRLNLALVLLNEQFMEVKAAAKQAKLALQEVSPFCDPHTNRGSGSLDEALALKAKACFRLGSAQYEMGDYNDAIDSLEESIQSTNLISDPERNTPDSLVPRRLAQAKREHLKLTRRQRKKFKFAFANSISELESEPATTSEARPTAKSTCLKKAPSSISSPTPGAAATSTRMDATSLGGSNPVTPMNSPATELQTGLESSLGPSEAPRLRETNQSD
mmetsp:Transcript_18979/g.52941  ORF Transcript_18979/g.52941 Transcript_18979/m.52941 type:complete len:1319 (+) Transcript_18979:207-4163(+)